MILQNLSIFEVVGLLSYPALKDRATNVRFIIFVGILFAD